LQDKPATLLIPIDFPFLFAVEELYGIQYQSGSFSLIYVGSGFHCLRSYLFFSMIYASPPICFHKVKAHSGIAVNECILDAIAKHSALHD
jgi:hypothetical protein